MNEKYEKVTEVFGSSVFNDSVMRERLPKGVYKSIKKTIDGYQDLDPALADRPLLML